MRNYKIYLNDIIESIKRIENSIKGLTKKDFEENIDIQDAIIRRIQIIGEAVKSLPLELKKKYPDIEWDKIAGTRDIVTHAYFRVNLDIIWDIIFNQLPDLKRKIEKIKTINSLNDTE